MNHIVELLNLNNPLFVPVEFEKSGENKYKSKSGFRITGEMFSRYNFQISDDREFGFIELPEDVFHDLEVRRYHDEENENGLL